MFVHPRVSQEDDHYRGGEEVLDQDVLAANQKVESRHAANREFLNQSADELANVYRERHKREQRFKSSMGMQDGGEFISRYAYTHLHTQYTHNTNHTDAFIQGLPWER